jgi:hypothetical protein
VKGKALLLIGGAAGYVLGTRAGRERYDQIKGAAGRLWQDPRVQDARHNAAEKVKEQVKEQVKEGVREAKDRIGSSPDEPDLQPVTSPGSASDLYGPGGARG